MNLIKYHVLLLVSEMMVGIHLLHIVFRQAIDQHNVVLNYCLWSGNWACVWNQQ